MKAAHETLGKPVSTANGEKSLRKLEETCRPNNGRLVFISSATTWSRLRGPQTRLDQKPQFRGKIYETLPKDLQKEFVMADARQTPQPEQNRNSSPRGKCSLTFKNPDHLLDSSSVSEIMPSVP